jgi:glycosyltransferase involved in cell wall biosynthesis
MREIDVNCIRVVDNFSEDDTVKIAQKYKAVIIQRKCGIGKARQYLIESVKTDYFAFIDSDVVLRRGWFDTVMRKMNSDNKIGAVCGLWLPDNPQERHFWEVCWKRVRADNPMWERGYLIDTLIKTEAVKGILIPERMNNYEDKFIRKHILSKGYNWTIAEEVVCDHLIGESSFWKTCLGRKYYGAGLREWKDLDPNASAKRLLSKAPTELANAFYIAMKARDPLIIPFNFLSYLFTVIGYFGSSRKLMEKIEKDAGYRRQYSKFRRNQK